MLEAERGERAGRWQAESTSKSKRGVIKPSYLPNQSAVHTPTFPDHDITFGVGPAGTGKTYLAVAAAGVDAPRASGDPPYPADPPRCCSR